MSKTPLLLNVFVNPKTPGIRFMEVPMAIMKVLPKPVKNEISFFSMMDTENMYLYDDGETNDIDAPKTCIETLFTLDTQTLEIGTWDNILKKKPVNV
jgi:hypothetical protein